MGMKGQGMKVKWVLFLLLAAMAGTGKVKTGQPALLQTNGAEADFGKMWLEFMEEVRPIPEKNLLIAQKDGLWGILSIQGEVMVPFLFDQIRYEGKAADQVLTVSWMGKEGCLSLSDFSELVPITYDSISDFVDGQAVVQRDGKYGVINKDGQLDVPVDCEQVPLLGGSAKAALLAAP